MNSLVNITLKEQEYQNLLSIKEFKEIELINIRITPNDLELKNDIVYQNLIKAYRKAAKDLEKYRFDKLVNK